MTKKRPSLFSGLTLIFIVCSCISPPPPALQAEGGYSVGRESGAPGEQPPEREAPARRLVRTEPEQTPTWKDKPPRSEEEIFFVGLSRPFSSTAEARNDARENAFTQVMRFYGEFIRSSAVERSSFSGGSADAITALVNREEELMNFAQAVVSQVGTDGYYTETYLNGQNREEYVVYALCRIPRQKAEQDIADFAKNTSERYGNLLAAPSSLRSALSAYGDILTALEQNPLHRTVVYYDSPAGRVNLYEYISLQLNTLAGGVSFASLPSAAVERGNTLDAAVRILAPLPAGGLDCAVNIYGMNNPSPTAKYTAGADGSFLLKIFSSRLEPGKYTVQLEALLRELNPRIKQNSLGSFALEVRPAQADVKFAGELTQAEQRALSQAVQQALQKHNVPLLAGHEFLVAFNARPQAEPVSGTSILRCDVSVSLRSAGSVLFQSASRRITEISRDQALKLAADYIVDNKDFWTGAAEYMRR